MRRLLLFALFAAATPLVQAQTTAAPAVSQQHIDAASDVAHLHLSDHLVTRSLDGVLGERAAEIRDTFLASELYEGLRDDTKRSMEAYVETIPAIFREEILVAIPDLRAAYAERLAAQFSLEDLQAIATAFRDPALTTAVEATAFGFAGEGLPDDAEMNDEQRAAIAALGATPEGAIFAARIGQMNDTLTQASRDSMSEMEGRLVQRVLTGLCAALADECPAYIQEAAQAL